METRARFTILDLCFCTVLIAILSTLAIPLTITERTNSRGLPHEQFDKMEIGGNAERHQPILRYGWLFGLLTIALFTNLVMLGARRGGKLGSGKWAFLLGGAIYMGIFTKVITEYGKSLRLDNPEFIFGFPAATTWMLFGVWAAPMVFIGLYVWKFHDWIYTPEDEERFQKLLATRKPSKDDV